MGQELVMQHTDIIQSDTWNGHILINYIMLAEVQYALHCLPSSFIKVSSSATVLPVICLSSSPKLQKHRNIEDIHRYIEFTNGQ